VGTWHDLDLGRPIAAPLEQCAELLGVDLATVRELATKVEPYLRADGTRIWSLMQLSGSSGPRPTAGVGAVISTADGSRLPMPSAATSNVRPVGGSGIEELRARASGERSTNKSARDPAIASRPRRSPRTAVARATKGCSS
jgi:hypothetical protein